MRSGFQGLVLLALCTLAPGAHAQVKDTARATGRTVKEAAKTAGRTVKESGRMVGRTVKGAVKGGSGGAKAEGRTGAKRVGSTAQQGGRKTRAAARQIPPPWSLLGRPRRTDRAPALPPAHPAQAGR